MFKDNPIGRTARHIREIIGNTKTKMSVGYTFKIARVDALNSVYFEADGTGHMIENCELVETPQREPIAPGTYGRVSVGSITHDNKRCVSIPTPGHGCTADELREAAHLFNQLAEQLENAAADKLTQGWQRTEHTDRIEHLVTAAKDDNTPTMGNVAGLRDREEAAYKHAARLYRSLCEKHYPEMPECNMVAQPTLTGVLDQIDHITAGLVRPVLAAPQMQSQMPAAIDPHKPHPFKRGKGSHPEFCRICARIANNPIHAVTVPADAPAPATEPALTTELRKLINDAVRSAIEYAGYPVPAPSRDVD